MRRVAYGGIRQGQQLRAGLEVQHEKLKQAGCAKIFREKRSGVDTGRPQLREALEYLREAAVVRLGS